MVSQQIKQGLFQGLLPSFAPTFLDDHAGRLMTDPQIALVELIANCWDAGADRVDVSWPDIAVPEPIEIQDNGTGMTLDQFTRRWRQFNYDRRREQGENVEFPIGNQRSHRKAFGRNGKGRHSMFCFANQYYVDTWRDGQACRFEVARTTGTTQTPYEINLIEQYRREGHGTSISAKLGRNYLPITGARDLIGSKFVTDPTFKVYLNGELVELTSLEHLINTQEISIPGIGPVSVSQIDTQAASRTMRPHGIAWWVNKRLVGEPSWKGFDDTGYLDGRTSEAKRYTFVVEADILANEVQEDWSEFRDTDRFRVVYSAVEKHIRQRIGELMRSLHKARKREALEDNRESLAELPSESRYYIGQTVDGIQERIPNIRQPVLSATVSVLSNLEKARSGYTLLEQLAKLQPDEIDELSDILAQWSIHEVQVVMGELEKRLKLIKRLEELVEDPSSDELHEIQPIFARGLWIFGPEYESVHFTSNQTLLTVIRKLFEDEKEVLLRNPRRRPDFVILSNSTVGLYASDAFNDQAEVNGFDKVLIVELKRGGSEITLEERRQGEDYAVELRKSGKIQKSTKIVVFVLGSEIAQEIDDDLKQGNTTVCARTYSVVLRQANARTFHLLEKIKDAKADMLLDLDVEEVLAKPQQVEMFAV